VAAVISVFVIMIGSFIQTSLFRGAGEKVPFRPAPPILRLLLHDIEGRITHRQVYVG
jgi:hypothetical protein